MRRLDPVDTFLIVTALMLLSFVVGILLTQHQQSNGQPRCDDIIGYSDGSKVCEINLRGTRR